MKPGEVAYEAYRVASGGVSLISGATLPGFNELDPKIQDAWEAAGRAAIRSWREGDQS